MYLTRTGSSIAGTPAKIRAKVAKLEQINAIVVSARINVLKRWLLLPPRTGVPATLRVAGTSSRMKYQVGVWPWLFDKSKRTRRFRTRKLKISGFPPITATCSAVLPSLSCAFRIGQNSRISQAYLTTSRLPLPTAIDMEESCSQLGTSQGAAVRAPCFRASSHHRDAAGYVDGTPPTVVALVYCAGVGVQQQQQQQQRQRGLLLRLMTFLLLQIVE